MRVRLALVAAAALGVLLALPAASAQQHRRILQSDVRSLTFQVSKMTTGRRLAHVPQMVSVSPRGAHSSSAMCTNSGRTDADGIVWDCKARLPDGAELDGLMVSCEGWGNSRDKYILDGSCQLRYSASVRGGGANDRADRATRAAARNDTFSARHGRDDTSANHHAGRGAGRDDTFGDSARELQEQHDREDALRQVREFQAAETAANPRRAVARSAALREQQQHRVEQAAEASRVQRAYESRTQAAEAKARRLEAAAKAAAALAEDLRRAAKAEKLKIKKMEVKQSRLNHSVLMVVPLIYLLYTIKSSSERSNRAAKRLEERLYPNPELTRTDGTEVPVVVAEPMEIHVTGADGQREVVVVPPECVKKVQ